MKIATICYAHSRGLGHLAKSFTDHGIITDHLVVMHPKIPYRQDWYPGATYTSLRGFQVAIAKDFIATFKEQGGEAMLFFETPFEWELMNWCKRVGVRTYLVTMYECTPLTHIPPYRYICPSLLDMKFFPQGIFLELPVEVSWRLRTHARHYIHNGGYLGIRHREGTLTLIDAMEHVKNDIKLTIRVQENVPAPYIAKMALDPRITYSAATIPFEHLYDIGDVAVGAQKWNGCSLPLQEAFASGLMVMNTARFPMTTWLPNEPLVEPASYIHNSSVGGSYLRFEEAVVDPRDLARKIDFWYGQPIKRFSECGREYAEEHSWEVLKPKWLEALSR